MHPFVKIILAETEKIIGVRVEEVQQCPLPFFVDLISQGEDGHRKVLLGSAQA